MTTSSPALKAIRAQVMALFEPPPVLKLSEWIEANLVLPASVSAKPGAVRLFPYQVGIADAISDPTIERVSLVKAARLGFTTLISGAVAGFIANDPCPLIVLQPTEDDARGWVVDDLEPIFRATPAVRGALTADKTVGEDRNTLTSKQFIGGSLKVIAAKSPRNLRRHNARVLLIDEADAMVVGDEGSPIALAEKRTMSFPNRKIVLGSTPLDADTSHVIRAYQNSDQRRFEVPCASCGTLHFIEWANIEWPAGRPDLAFYRCPNCGEAIDEIHKNSMVNAGQWIAQKPEVQGHAGFLINALVSPLRNASWGKLAEEFVTAKDDPSLLKPFVNTVLATGWTVSDDRIDESSLAARVEDFGLDRMPVEVLAVCEGCDLQDDRAEISFVGFSKTGEIFVLGHSVIWGDPADNTFWAEIDEALKTRWRHPLGSTIGVEVVGIDSGDGEHTSKVYSFCAPRQTRGVLPIKGVAGKRPALVASGGKLKGTGGARLYIVGVDTLKHRITDKLERGRSIRFSDSLPASYFEQLTSEHRVLRYIRGRPEYHFERISGRRSETLDCLVYAMAVRERIQENWTMREGLLSKASKILPPRGMQQYSHAQLQPGGRRTIASNYLRD